MHEWIFSQCSRETVRGIGGTIAQLRAWCGLCPLRQLAWAQQSGRFQIKTDIEWQSGPAGSVGNDPKRPSGSVGGASSELRCEGVSYDRRQDALEYRLTLFNRFVI
jgi:hypothetical protein